MPARPATVPARSRALTLALALAAIVVAASSGCAAAPDRAEGTVRYRDPTGKEGRGGRIVGVTTGDTKRGDVGVSPEDMGALVGALDDIGLFDLGGRPSVPSEQPPGSIAVDTNVRKFIVTLQDLKSVEDSERFSRSAYRVVAATQGGPHYSIPKPK